MNHLEKLSRLKERLVHIADPTLKCITRNSVTSKTTTHKPIPIQKVGQKRLSWLCERVPLFQRLAHQDSSLGQPQIVFGLKVLDDILRRHHEGFVSPLEMREDKRLAVPFYKRLIKEQGRDPILIVVEKPAGMFVLKRDVPRRIPDAFDMSNQAESCVQTFLEKCIMLRLFPSKACREQVMNVLGQRKKRGGGREQERRGYDNENGVEEEEEIPFQLDLVSGLEDNVAGLVAFQLSFSINGGGCTRLSYEVESAEFRILSRLPNIERIINEGLLPTRSPFPSIGSNSLFSLNGTPLSNGMLYTQCTGSFNSRSLEMGSSTSPQLLEADNEPLDDLFFRDLGFRQHWKKFLQKNQPQSDEEHQAEEKTMHDSEPVNFSETPKCSVEELLSYSDIWQGVIPQPESKAAESESIKLKCKFKLVKYDPRLELAFHTAKVTNNGQFPVSLAHQIRFQFWQAGSTVLYDRIYELCNRIQSSTGGGNNDHCEHDGSLELPNRMPILGLQCFAISFRKRAVFDGDRESFDRFTTGDEETEDNAWSESLESLPFL